MRAFALPQSGEPDQHPQCLFPARRQWLTKQLPAHPAWRQSISCPAFDTWTRAGTVQSVSVVLATGYMGNPASYYGHTLLKFNFPGDQKASRLMDVSVNYGAILEGQHDSQISYIVKSLFGGYDAGFSHIHFYFHDHNYGDQELRDLWEYELALPQDGVQMIVAHAWEVLGKRYTYYFFTSNCASRMRELLGVVDGLSLPEDRHPWAVPQEFIRQISAGTYQGRPLLAQTRYHPSRQARFYGRFQALAPAQRAVLRALAKHSGDLGSRDYAELAVEEKQSLLDAWIDYLQVVNNPIAEADPAARHDYQLALGARFSLPPGQQTLHQEEPTPPDRARPSGWLQSGVVDVPATTGWSLRYRPAYYDPLDSDSGHVSNGALAMGDTQVELRQGRFRLSHLEAIRVESVNPARSGLPGDDGSAWKLAVGAEQARLDCYPCLVARAQGDVGVGRPLNSQLFAAAYVGAALQNREAGQGLGFGRVSADLIGNAGPNWRARGTLEWRVPAGHVAAPYLAERAEVRCLLGPDTDLRVGLQQDHIRRIDVSLGLYW